MEESLPVVTLEAVGVLGSEPMPSSLLSPEEDKATASGETFLRAKEAGTLFEECLAMQQVCLPLEYTHLPVQELALESKLDESGDSPTH